MTTYPVHDHFHTIVLNILNCLGVCMRGFPASTPVSYHSLKKTHIRRIGDPNLPVECK